MATDCVKVVTDGEKVLSVGVEVLRKGEKVVRGDNVVTFREKQEREIKKNSSLFEGQGQRMVFRTGKVNASLLFDCCT